MQLCWLACADRCVTIIFAENAEISKIFLRVHRSLHADLFLRNKRAYTLTNPLVKRDVPSAIWSVIYNTPLDCFWLSYRKRLLCTSYFLLSVALILLVCRGVRMVKKESDDGNLSRARAGSDCGKRDVSNVFLLV